MLVASGMTYGEVCVPCPGQLCHRVFYDNERESETKFCYMCQCLLTYWHKNDQTVHSGELGKGPISLQVFQLAVCLRGSL